MATLVGMTAMAPARTEPDLSFLLDHTSHVLRTRMAAALAEIGLTARMHCVLVHALEEERTQIQLAEIGDMDKTTMVVTVDALEKAGLAERRPSSTDRRARIIAVTEEGARGGRAEPGDRRPRARGGAGRAARRTSARRFCERMNRLVDGPSGHARSRAPQPVRRARQRTKARSDKRSSVTELSATVTPVASSDRRTTMSTAYLRSRPAPRVALARPSACSPPGC